MMKESYTVIVVTKPAKPYDKEEYLKYRNVTDVQRLFKYLKAKNKLPNYANLYDKKSQQFLRREYAL